MLVETPAALGGPSPDAAAATRVIEAARRENREWLSEPEAKQVLAAYGIPIVESRIAASVAGAVECAEDLGYPVAVKILAPGITHKTDVGGVALDLDSPVAVERASTRMADRLHDLRPEAELDGFIVQRMARRPAAHELIVGSATDPVFGPVMLFGQGGTAVEVIGDRAVALPPLNETLARLLVERTRVAHLLAGYRDRPPADMAAIHRTLVQASRLVIDQPRVLELDINPLLADDEGVLALDARIRIDLSDAGARPRLAIRPYPEHLEEQAVLADGSAILLRPIRPEDEPAHREFFEALSPEDVRTRFFGLLREMTHSSLARYTVIDYDREMAFIATEIGNGGPPPTLGVVRTISDPDNTRAEFAIIVRSSEKGRGLGRLLLEKMIRYCRDRGMEEIVGQVLPDNRPMLELARSLGFERLPGRGPVDGVVEVRLECGRPRLSKDLRV
jgi:acetyltransferase